MPIYRSQIEYSTRLSLSGMPRNFSIPLFLLLPIFCLAQQKAVPITTVQLSVFQMPQSVREQFQSSGCLVAQSNLLSEHHNVLHGEFAAPGQQDWMAACKSNDGRIQSRFVWGGPQRCESPLSEDMTLHLLAGLVELQMAPYMEVAPPRTGQDHERLLQRWSVTGVWSYYCHENHWEKTHGDSCRNGSAEEHLPTAKLKLSKADLEDRRDFKRVGLEQLRRVIVGLSPTLDVSRLNARCMPDSSNRQTCYFEIVGNESVNASVALERVRDAWFATKTEALVCQLQ